MIKRKSATLQDELASFLDDVVELARSSTGLDNEKLEELKESFRAKVDELGTGARDAARNIADHTDEALARADAYAHEKPWHMVIAAGLMGLALGVLVSRR